MISWPNGHGRETGVPYLVGSTAITERINADGFNDCVSLLKFKKLCLKANMAA